MRYMSMHSLLRTFLFACVALVFGGGSGPVCAQTLIRLGSTGLDYGKAVAIDDDRNAYLALYFQNTVDFDSGPSTSNLPASSFVDIAFAKYDAGGNLIWARHLPNTNATPAQADIPHGIVIDAQTNLYLTGYYSGTLDFDPGPGQVLRTSFGNYDAWVSSYDPNGNWKWTQTLGNTNIGNATEERAYDIAVEPSGHAYIAGFFEGALNRVGLASAGGQDGVISKFDPFGNPDWTFALGSTTNDQVQAIALDGLGHLFAIGSFRGTVDFDPGPATSNLTSIGAGTDIFAARYTTNAVLNWAFRIGGNGFDQGAPGGLSADPTGNIYFTGRFQQTTDFDPGPGTRNLTSTGGDDLFVASYTPDGALRWVFAVGGNGLDGGHRVRLDPETNVYVSGWFTGNADFDGGSGTHVVSATSTNGGSDAFIAKYDTAGNFLWVAPLHLSVGNTNFGIAAGMAVDSRGLALLTGQFFGDSTLVAGAQDFALTNAGNSDCFLARFDANGGLAGAEIGPISGTTTSFTFRVASAAGRDYVHEISADLIGWTPVSTQTAAGPLDYLRIPVATTEFHRVRAVD